MTFDCPNCTHSITPDEEKWAYDRFGRRKCSNCGWTGERFRIPPLAPRKVDASGIKVMLR